MSSLVPPNNSGNRSSLLPSQGGVTRIDCPPKPTSIELDGLLETYPELKFLAAQKVVMIDDKSENLAFYGPYLHLITGVQPLLISITNGSQRGDLDLGPTSAAVVGMIQNKLPDPTLLLIDGEMPISGGGPFLALKLKSAFPSVKIVAFPANFNSSNEFKECGINDLVIKIEPPTSPDSSASPLPSLCKLANLLTKA